MGGTNRKLAALIGAVTIVVFTLVLLVTMYVMHVDNSVIGNILGFVTPTITTLLVFGTAKEVEQNDDEQHH